MVRNGGLREEAVWLSLSNLGFDADDTDIEDFLEDLEERGYVVVSQQ